jgi:hypothetical protein
VFAAAHHAHHIYLDRAESWKLLMHNGLSLSREPLIAGVLGETQAVSSLVIFLFWLKSFTEYYFKLIGEYAGVI